MLIAYFVCLTVCRFVGRLAGTIDSRLELLAVSSLESRVKREH